MAEAESAECGSSLVEFALILLFLLAMIFGVVDFGRSLYAYHFVSHAAREATRWAAVNGSTCGTDAPPGSCTAPMADNNGTYSLCTGGCTPASSSDVADYVAMITPLGIDRANVTTTVPCGVSDESQCASSSAISCTSATANAPGCNVEVQVSYRFNFLIPLVHKGSITMSSTSEMVIAH